MGAAPERALTVTLEKEESIEVLLYGDNKFSYRLSSIDVARCRECPSNRALRSQIERDSPGISDLIRNNWKEGAVRLLDWVANDIDWGQVDWKGRSLYLMGAPDLHDIWKTNASAGHCGAIANYFQKVLEIFGIQAFTIDFGFAGSIITHVSTVIADPNEGGFYIFDPTFNAVYRGPDNEILDVESLLGGAAAHFDTRPIKRDSHFPYLISSRNRTIPIFAEMGYDRRQCSVVSKHEKHMFCPDTPFDLRRVKSGWREAMQRARIDEADDLFLTLLRKELFTLGGSASRSQRTKLLALFRNAGIKAPSQ